MGKVGIGIDKARRRKNPTADTALHHSEAPHSTWHHNTASCYMIACLLRMIPPPPPILRLSSVLYLLSRSAPNSQSHFVYQTRRNALLSYLPEHNWRNSTLILMAAFSTRLRVPGAQGHCRTCRVPLGLSKASWSSLISVYLSEFLKIKNHPFF